MYDKEKIYDEQISPLMTKIIEICQKNDISYMADFYLKEPTDENSEMYCTSFQNPAHDRKIEDLFNVAYNGYVVSKPFCVALTIRQEDPE